MNIVTKAYDSLLPFLVVEALSSQALSVDSMSVNMIDKGWAWLICGRKLLVWRFKENDRSDAIKTRRTLSPCFELQLPQSDLVHRAELVNVFFLPQNPNTSQRAITVPAAIAVSPEGIVRVWSSIANERFTESTVAELQGLEFCTLEPLSQTEYLLGTTTGSIYLLIIDVTAHDSKGMITCISLSETSGLLSGIGRRVTNLFFGPMETNVGSDTKRPLIAVPKYSQSMIDKTGSTDKPFFILGSNFKLRQWTRSHEGVNSENRLIREWELQKNIHSKLISEVGSGESNSLSFWPVDMITTKAKELLILIVTIDTSRDNAINYATCIFNPYQAGDTIASLTILKSHSWNYSNESEDQLFALRFLERRTTSPQCFMYDRKFLFLVQIDNDILDAIDYGIQLDGILGAGIVDGSPLLFTLRDGLTYVVPVVSNRSRMNETSIQLENPPPGMSNNKTSEVKQTRQDISQQPMNNQTEPMLVEIDVDEDDRENEQSTRLDQSRSRPNKSQPVPSVSISESSFNKSADQSTRSKTDELNDILKENKEFEWVQQIDAKNYGLAGETLERLATESETLKDRKETLLALSKLAKLAE